MSAKAKGVVILAAAVFFGSNVHPGHHHHHGGSATLTDAAIPWSGGYSQASWASAFLKGAGMPRTGCNMSAVEAWERAEGTFSAYRNPLDSTQREPGSYSINSVGVQHYASWSQGLHATVVTLFNGYYPGIVSALRAGNDAQRVANAVDASPWGTSAFSVTC